MRHDYWYLDKYSINGNVVYYTGQASSIRGALVGLYTTKSQDLRHSPRLGKLEAEFQTRFAHKSRDSVKRLIYFSVCIPGLKDHVEAWTSAHPGLAWIAQRLQTGTTALLELYVSK